MANNGKSDAVWVEVDVDSLDAAQREAYVQYKALYRQMKAQREAFEVSMSADVQSGKRMIFGYNFGRLSIAVVEDDRKIAKPKTQRMSLAEYLAAQQR